MPRTLTSEELELLHGDVQWSKLYLASLKPNTIYTATLSVVPASNDLVYQITFTGGVGTLGDVKAGMTLYVGTSAGGFELGMCRIRKSPIAGTFYIGLTSEINWAAGGTIHLTVVDDFDLWAKDATVSAGVLSMDVDITYSDQHSAFSPVPIMGSHAVLWLDEATVDVDFDAGDSWVIGSSISGYSWSAPGASASSGMSTATPTITYNAPGIYRVYLTVTAANGKTTMGVRHVFVYDRDENMPATVFQLAQCVGDYDTGGWMFDMTMQAEASLSEIRDRSLIVLFAEDWYGNVKQSIGPLEGRENIVCVGRVVGESLRWDRESGLVHFTVQGFHHWLNKIDVRPVELGFVGAATDWEGMPALNTDRALWHVLFWRSTVIETMDFYPPNDARYRVDAKTISAKIWSQLQDLAFNKIFASPGVDRFGRLFVEVDPQMVAEAGRDWPTVQEITDDDFQEAIDFQRVIVNDVSYISLNAEEVNSGATSVTRYSLWPGHVPRRYGDPELLDRFLCASQSQANQMAGLAGGWRTNPFPDVPVIFAQNNRMIDLFPRQFCSIGVAAENTPRGVAVDTNLIPRRMALYFDGDSGYMHPEINFEAETFEQPAVDGDVPESEDVDFSIPPIPGLPRLPDIDLSLPGLPGNPTEGGPNRVLGHDSLLGLLHGSRGSTSALAWITVNAGLTTAQYQGINRVIVCPNGAIYVGRVGNSAGASGYFLARAPYIGGTFVIIEDQDSLNDKYSQPSGTGIRLGTFNYNPLVSESVVYLIYPQNFSDTIYDVYLGSGSTFAHTMTITSVYDSNPSISYGNGVWVLTHGIFPTDSGWKTLNAALTAVIDSDTFTEAAMRGHTRKSTTTTIIHYLDGTNAIAISTGNMTDIDRDIATGSYAAINVIFDDSRLAIDPSGNYLMTIRTTTGHGKSSDGGFTLVDIPALPFTGFNWRFAYAGGAGLSSCWVAAGSYVMYSDDFGTTWSDIQGNLPMLNPLYQLDIVKVLEF